MRASRDLHRLAAWGLAALAAAVALAAWLALSASSDLSLGRERLLAGDTASADAAFARARRWPLASAAARAGGAVSAARAGRVTAEVVPLADLEALAVEALIQSVVGEGRLDTAGALADLARQAGHPVGGLYAAALAFERGDEAKARVLAAQSPVPLASRGLGSRLLRALEARDAGAGKLLFDRNGALVAIVGREGGIEADPGIAPLLGGVIERLEALPEGDAARLSIDLGLSRLALEALGGLRGSIVLVEPRTGAVLAAVSDERTAAAEGAAAFTQRREPASIAKLLTSAAAYRAGIDADVEIRRMSCGGVERYGGKPLWCPFAAGPLEGLDHALALSCNVAFANLGTRLGAERMVAEYRRWGFDAGGGALLGAAGRVHTPPRTPRQLADLSVGLELADVTPLHAALLAAIVASDGRLPEPRLVTGACGALGLRDEPLPLSAGRDVLEPPLARRLRRAMEAVAGYGTGVGLAPPGFPIAMKTGTAAERGRGYHVNYIGMGPLPDPSVAFCVRVTNERTSPAVTRAAREVTRRLLAALADRRPALVAAARPRVETQSLFTPGRAGPPGPLQGKPVPSRRGPAHGRSAGTGQGAAGGIVRPFSHFPEVDRAATVGTRGAGQASVGESKLRILVADDEEGVLFALKEYLGCCGWDVDAARSASDAERLLEVNRYAAVITDLRFSGPSGMEGLAIVRSARKRNPEAPIVMMTGYGSPDTEAEARRLGVDAFVPKPVPLWELARLVQGWAAS